MAGRSGLGGCDVVGESCSLKEEAGQRDRQEARGHGVVYTAQREVQSPGGGGVN